MFVGYGRQAIYQRAGNVIECRYCVQYGAAPSPRGLDAPYCPLREWHVFNPKDNCTRFERAIGTDDDA